MTEAELHTLADEVDEAIARRDVAELSALQVSLEQRAEAQDDEADAKPRLYYFASNAVAAIGTERRKIDDGAWAWNQDAIVEQVRLLRKTIEAPARIWADAVLCAQVYTNLGNALSTLGRPAAALTQWRTALDHVPEFGMARGNAASCALNYAERFYDQNHSGIAALYAGVDLEDLLVGHRAVWDAPDPSFALSAFAANRVRAHDLWDACGRPDGDVEARQLGRSDDERTYHRWCKAKVLYLNPLADISAMPAATGDVLHLPSHTYRGAQVPRFPRYYDLLKQQYACSRWRLFDGERSDETEPDVGTEGVDYYGDPSVCLTYGADQLREALLGAYRIFDQVALFLADYFDLSIDPSGVNLRSVWTTQERGGSRPLRPQFDGSPNWMLRGLYYLSRDLYDPTLREAADPDARRIYELRRQAEHRFLAIRHWDTGEEDTPYYVGLSKAKMLVTTYGAVRLAREALIYLSFAMHREERRRSDDERDDRLMIATMIAEPIGP